MLSVFLVGRTPLYVMFLLKLRCILFNNANDIPDETLTVVWGKKEVQGSQYVIHIEDGFLR